PQESWQENHSFAFAIHRELSECLHLTGRYDEAQAQLATLLDHADTTMERAGAYQLQMLFHTMRRSYSAAIGAGTEGLKAFDIAIRANPTWDEIQVELKRVEALQGGRHPSELYDLPELIDPEKRAAMGLLASMFPPAYLTGNRELYILSTLMVIRMT